MQNGFIKRGPTGKDENEKAIARVTCEMVRPELEDGNEGPCEEESDGTW